MLSSPDFSEIDMIDGAAILNAGSHLYVYAVNRSTDQVVDLEIDLAGAELEAISSELLHHHDPSAANSWDKPNEVRRVPHETKRGRAALVELPANSFLAVTFRVC
tara:strand:- start:6628 stop:6942 length:315 start_codon:yes stop_codon:yes gene_type:complete